MNSDEVLRNFWHVYYFLHILYRRVDEKKLKLIKGKEPFILGKENSLTRWRDNSSSAPVKGITPTFHIFPFPGAGDEISRHDGRLVFLQCHT